MKTFAYTITQKTNKEQKVLLFDKDFFVLLDDDLRRHDQFDSLEVQHRNILAKLIPHLVTQYFEDLPMLVSRILRLGANSYQVLLMSPPAILPIKLTLQANAMGKESLFDNEYQVVPTNDIPIPQKLSQQFNPNMYKILDQYISYFHKAKQKQLDAFHAGHRYVIFSPEKEPNFVAPVQASDVKIETLAGCIPEFVDVLRQGLDLQSDYASFLEAKDGIEKLTNNAETDAQMRRYLAGRLRALHLEPKDLVLIHDSLVTQTMLLSTIRQHSEHDTKLSIKFLEYLTSTQYLEYFKDYLAWALHFFAVSYHSLIQQETENMDRRQKLAAFKSHFENIIQIDDNGDVPTLLQFKKGLRLSLEEIAAKLNVFLKKECNTSYFISSDKQRLFVNQLNKVAETIQSKIKELPYLKSFVPFTCWQKGVLGATAAGFKWSKEAEELEQHNTRCWKEIREIITTDNTYLQISKIFPVDFQKQLLEFQQNYQLLSQQYRDQEIYLTRTRKTKKHTIINQACRLIQESQTALLECKKISTELADDTSIECLNTLEQEIHMLQDKINNCPLRRIRATKIDILDKTLSRLTNRCLSLPSILSDLKSKQAEALQTQADQTIAQQMGKANYALRTCESLQQSITQNCLLLQERFIAVPEHPNLSFASVNLYIVNLRALYSDLLERKNKITSNTVSALDNKDFMRFVQATIAEIQEIALQIQSCQRLLQEYDVITSRALIEHEIKNELQALHDKLADLSNVQAHIKKYISHDRVSEFTKQVEHLQNLLQQCEELLKSLRQDNNQTRAGLEKLAGQARQKMQESLQIYDTLKRLDVETYQEHVSSRMREAFTHLEEIYNSCQAYNFPFYNYISTEEPLLANSMDLTTLHLLQTKVLPLIEQDVDRLHHLSQVTNDQVSTLDLKLKIAECEKVYAHGKDVALNFMQKIVNDLQGHAKLIRSNLSNSFKEIFAHHGRILNDQRKKFNTINLQLEQLLSQKTPTNFKLLVNYVTEVNDTLTQLHQTHQEIASLIDTMLTKSRLVQLRRCQQPQTVPNSRYGLFPMLTNIGNAISSTVSALSRAYIPAASHLQNEEKEATQSLFEESDGKTATRTFQNNTILKPNKEFGHQAETNDNAHAIKRSRSMENLFAKPLQLRLKRSMTDPIILKLR